MHDALFQPFSLGPFTLRSRVVMAPMTRCRADAAGVVGPLTVEYYRQRASAGLIVTEGTQPSYEGQGYCRTPGVHTPAQVEAWRRVTDAVHAEGGRIFVQLMHVGRVGHPANQHVPAGFIAPSAIQAPGEMYTDALGPQAHATPREATLADIARVIEDHRVAARCAHDAGFDGVELHGANGYLVSQFLSTGTNHRQDAYGGDAQGRSRLGAELLAAMVDELGPGRVGVRISPGVNFNGMSDDDPLDTHAALLRRVEGLPLAYVHLMRTGWPHIAALRAMVRVPFILAGGFDAASGAAALEAGEADLIAYGRAFVANPDLPARFAKGAPLTSPDPRTFYSPGPEGYIDYPSAR